MALFNLKPAEPEFNEPTPEMEAFLQGFSIEVMPRTAEKIDDFREYHREAAAAEPQHGVDF